jgi:hypothetical protein
MGRRSALSSFSDRSGNVSMVIQKRSNRRLLPQLLVLVGKQKKDLGNFISIALKIKVRKLSKDENQKE